MEHRVGIETTGTSKPYEGGTERRGEVLGTDRKGDKGSEMYGTDKRRGDMYGTDKREGDTFGTHEKRGLEDKEDRDRGSYWDVDKGRRFGGGSEMKLTAASAFKEAKTVLGNIMLRTLSGAEKSAAEKLTTAWKCLADWSTGSFETSYKTYLQTSLKYDEAKHALHSLSLAHLDAQELQFRAASKNMCEKQEILKRYVEKHKTYDITKSKFLMKDREWIESIQRFIELGISTCHSFHDAFDESVRDYWFYTEKLNKCLDRKKEFKDMKDKMDTDTYMKYKTWLGECKKDTEKKTIKSKIDCEELRRKIVHFHHDCAESTTEVLEFLRNRIPEYERLGKQHTDVAMISTAVENLRKKSVLVRDMLEECHRKEGEKLPKFEDKRIIERLVHSHIKGFESGDYGTRYVGDTSTRQVGDTSGRHVGDTGTRHVTTSIRVGADK